MNLISVFVQHKMANFVRDCKSLPIHVMAIVNCDESVFAVDYKGTGHIGLRRSKAKIDPKVLRHTLHGDGRFRDATRPKKLFYLALNA